MKIELLFISASAKATYAAGAILDKPEAEAKDMIRRRLAKAAPETARLTPSLQEQAAKRVQTTVDVEPWQKEIKARRAGK